MVESNVESQASLLIWISPLYCYLVLQNVYSYSELLEYSHSLIQGVGTSSVLVEVTISISITTRIGIRLIPSLQYNTVGPVEKE